MYRIIHSFKKIRQAAMCKQMWEDASCKAIYMYAVTYQLFAPKECICLVQKSQETMKN